MRIVEPGHIYEVFEVDHPPDAPDGGSVQTIIFVRRRGDDAELLAAKPLEGGRHPGILGQELIRVLIDRTLYLNAEDACQEDVEIVNHLRDCLRLYESRAARRTIEKLSMPERADACPICHHVLCSHRHPESVRLEHESPR